MHHPVFSELNLTIQPGEKIGLIGHSGSGKSTLINLLLKNFALNSGAILLDDLPIEQITADSVRAQIALIPQDIMLFHRSIGENIGYAKEQATIIEIQQAANDAHSYFARFKATEDNVKAMQESFRYVQQKFDVGVLNATDYTVAKANLFKSQSDFYQAKYQYIFQLKILDFYKGNPITL